MTELYKTLKNYGKVKLNEPLSKHTTFKIGGPADYFVIVERSNDLIALLKFLDAEGVEYFLLGGGSNMLVRDEGYPGVVIHVQTKEIKTEGTTIIADAGCSTVTVANVSMKEGLVGFEWGVGVPGTIGGAVRGNAGAMGGDMSQSLEKVEVYQDGELKEMTHEECKFQYRHSIFKQSAGVIVRVHLKLQKSEDKEGMKKALAHLQYRSKTQPQGYASTGCIFKNFKITNKKLDFEVPEEFQKKGIISAGWLIDQAGMKGIQCGQAKVSETHGNFIINLGGATATDVLHLIEKIKEQVYNKFALDMEEEIQIV